MGNDDLTDQEWRRILNEIGRITKGRYNKNLHFGAGNYRLGLLKNALKYEVTSDLQLTFKIDSGDAKLDKLAMYFEYGTGMNNTQFRKKYIRPIHGDYMRFKYKGKWITTDKVRGVRPIFMMTKAIKSIENEWDTQIRRARIRLGI